MDGEAVVVLHGLGGSRGQMRPLHDYLADRGYQVFSVGYPSTRGGVDQHAEQLARVIDSLAGIDRIHFVAHSLGNLVIRRWMADNTDPTTGAPIDNRVGRLVMIGPPNHRPLLATYLEPLDPRNTLAGQSGRELNRDWDRLEPKLALPQGEFGILAGGKSDGEGWNPFIPGDDDLTVGVEEAKLAGACDFRVVEVVHRYMASSRAIHELTLAFLREGRFGEESERRRLDEP
ncbi:Alpha/beta hydrolase family protein [Planctomycetes bacterium MalM25]|nr:Alpha/beta hydrolase family protein [Planctomycetes bacterium MalM25]